MSPNPIIRKKTSQSPEATIFRKLSREEKLDELLQFCRKHKRIPRPFKSGTDEQERYLGNFYFNNKSQLNKYASAFPASELAIFNEIETFISKHIPRVTKLNNVFDFCNKHKHLPSQNSKDASERKLALLLISIKNSSINNPYSAEESAIMDKVIAIKEKLVKSKKGRLLEVLAFCKKTGSTPRQHVLDIQEKRMGEFFTTMKMALKRNTLDADCIAIVNEILVYAPPTKEQRLVQLSLFVKTNKQTPKINSDDIEERRLAAFFTKMKLNHKNNNLSSNEIKIMDSITTICNVKTRIEKINDLLDYTNSIGRVPKLNSNDSTERKNAMFLNNMKQLSKKKKLNPDENSIIDSIVNSESLVAHY